MSAAYMAVTNSPGTASGDITTDQAITRLKRMCDEKGINVSVSKCRRLVVSHSKQRDVVSAPEFAAIVRTISYSDPTGNTAARNVDRSCK